MKKIKYILIAIIIGMIIGKYIFNQYNNQSIQTMSEGNYVYLLQYGVYKDINNIKKSSQNLPN